MKNNFMKRILALALTLSTLLTLCVFGAGSVVASATTPIPVETWDVSYDDGGVTQNDVTAYLYKNEAYSDASPKYDLVISGTGKMRAGWGTANRAPWYSTYGQQIVNITIEEGVTNISDEAFSEISATHVNIASTVKTIGSYAFYETPIEAVSGGEGLEEIELCAFRGTALKVFVAHENMNYIRSSTFEKCNQLEAFVVLGKDTHIQSSSNTISKNATIYGYTGSNAETHATNYGYNFVPFCEGAHSFSNGYCTVCYFPGEGDSSESECTKNEYGYCKHCQLGLAGQSVNLGKDLSMIYYVDVIDPTLIEGKEFSVKFVFNGKETKQIAYQPDYENRYSFILEGITPQQMGDRIDAYVMIDGEIVDAKTDYSVEKNLINLIALYPNDETLVQLANDMLVYGQKAQVYRDYNLSNPIADEITLTPSQSFPEAEYPYLNVQYNDRYDYRIVSAGVRFDSTNCLWIKAYVPSWEYNGEKTVNVSMLEGSSWSIYYENDENVVDLGNGYYKIYFNPLTPTQFNDNFDFAINLDAEGIQADDYLGITQYNVNYWCYDVFNNGTLDAETRDLALALYRYGVSAEAYCAAHNE